MAGVTMDVSIETLSSLERRLTVSLPADRLEGEVRDRLRELSRSVQMKGFRRGKVPAKVVEQRFGAQVRNRSEEHTSELQSLMRISYAVFCLQQKNHMQARKTK